MGSRRCNLVRELLAALHGESLAPLPPRPFMEALLGCAPAWSSFASQAHAEGSGAPLQEHVRMISLEPGEVEQLVSQRCAELLLH